MALQDLLKEMAKLTPEEQKALRGMFAPVEAAPSATDGIDPVALQEAKTDLRSIYPHVSEAALQKMAIEQINRPRIKQVAKPARAQRVYFFQQANLFVTENIEADPENPDVLKKTGYYLPPRVIMVDEKQAARLYWKQRGKYQYMGRSAGIHWKMARDKGMPVHEASGVEFEEMKKAPDHTPPPNREKTVFAGTKIAQISRGTEIDWGLGLKQTGSN